MRFNDYSLDMSQEFVCPIQSHARQFTGLAVNINDSLSVTYSDLNHHICVVEDFLKSYVHSYDIIAFAISDSYFQILIFWALIRLNKIAFPINHAFPKVKVDSILKEHSIEVCITDDTIFSIIPIQNLSEISSFSSHNNTRYINHNQIATVILTSGSSGGAKGVVHTFNHHIKSAKASKQLIDINHKDCWYWNLPIYHVSGLSILFRVFLSGASLYIPQKKNVFRSKAAITHYSMVSTQLRQYLSLYKSSPFKLEGLKYILLGGSFFPEALLKQALAISLPIYMSYGMTEAASQISTMKCSKHHCLFSGKTLPHLKSMVIDDEICIQGDSLGLGYLVEGKLEPLVSDNGWFHTKDIGTIENDLIQIKGRKDRMFVSGGENIHPENIERSILSTGLVSSVIVEPVCDDQFGFRPVAFIDSVITDEFESKLTVFLKERIPSFMIPKKFKPLNQYRGTFKPKCSL